MALEYIHLPVQIVFVTNISKIVISKGTSIPRDMVIVITNQTSLQISSENG